MEVNVYLNDDNLASHIIHSESIEKLGHIIMNTYNN